MERKPFSKNTAATVLSAATVVALLVCCAVLGDRSMTQNQLSTLKILAVVCGCSILYCFSVGEITKNYSQMDKLWSILPVAYAWITAARGGMKLRLVLFALTVSVWGIRLTVNFARKGAYSIRFWTGVEDYRWKIVRGFPMFRSAIAWSAFDLFFISIYQNLLVLAICLPALACMESTEPLGAWDVAAAVSAVAFLALETVADEYQWRFYKTRKKLLAERGSLELLPLPYNLGFNISGPWGFMRHPNYLGEQGIWMSLYFFTLGAGAVRFGVFSVTMAGPLLLILLFMGSSALGESISLKKYPKYADYREKVFKYLPLRRYRADQ